MKSAIFITARLKSGRLPKKLLLPIEGKAVIHHLIDRLKLAKLPDLIVLCTSTNPQDSPLVQYAKANSIECFRGSEDDVLLRFLEAAKKFSVNFIVVTWGDELFCDAEHIDKVISFFEETYADLILSDTLPLGTYTYGLKVEALERVCAMKKERDTEVWGKYFTESGFFDVRHLPVEKEFARPDVRITLDYPEDLQLVKEIFARLRASQNTFSLRTILDLLDKNPELRDINKDCQAKYEQQIAKQASKTRY